MDFQIFSDLILTDLCQFLKFNFQIFLKDPKFIAIMHQNTHTSHPPILIYDVDGPLVTSKPHYLAVLSLKHDTRLQWNQEALQQVSAKEIIRRFESNDASSNKTFIKKIYQQFAELLPSRRRRIWFFIRLGLLIRPYEWKYGDFLPEVTETIEKFHSQGILQGICSSSEGKRIQKWLDKKQLSSIITTFASRDDRKRVGVKPNPGPVLLAILRLKHHYNLGKIDKSRVVFIGDNVSDIVAGKKAGVKTIAVLSGHGIRSELMKSEPDLIVQSVADLPRKLRELVSL